MQGDQRVRICIGLMGGFGESEAAYGSSGGR